MFGNRRKGKSVSSPVVDSFDDPAIKHALSGKWVTLALSHFETHFTTNHEREDWHQAVGVGYVHFAYLDRLLRARLTLSETPLDLARGEIGIAHFEYMSGEEPYVIFEVVVQDLRGKIARAVQASFDSAALSQSRYLHLHFRREEIDQETALMEVRDKNYGGYHRLLEINIAHQTTLIRAPSSSWSWSK